MTTDPPGRLAGHGGDDDLATRIPAALVAHHGPFTWGATVRESFEHAVIREAVAEMAPHTLARSGPTTPPRHLLDRHCTRKHGPGAYDGNAARTGA